jgi:hypothetical protein
VGGFGFAETPQPKTCPEHQKNAKTRVFVVCVKNRILCQNFPMAGLGLFDPKSAIAVTVLSSPPPSNSVLDTEKMGSWFVKATGRS